MNYTDTGASVELKRAASIIMYKAAQQSWEHRRRKMGEIITLQDNFSGIRGMDISSLPLGTMLGANSDGIGTKAELAERRGKYETIAYDLLAMVCDDAAVQGAEPVAVVSTLDVNTLFNGSENYLNNIELLAAGYLRAARDAKVGILNGETAELGQRISGYGPFNYNWNATALWFAKKQRLRTGQDIKAGDAIVGLPESGFRCNGFSLVRRILEDSYGPEWHTQSYFGHNLAELALTPSRIYTRVLVEMTGGYIDEPLAEIHGLAHITGGGIPEKLSRILKPSGLGALLDEPFSPPEFMSYLQRIGKVPDAEAYRTWNMGQGMLIITPEPERVMRIASRHSIESKVVGRIVSEKKIMVKNKGEYGKGELLEF